MIGIEIMIDVLPSVYRVMLSTLRKVVEAFIKLVSSAANQSDHLTPFWRVTVILLSSKKGIGLWCLQVPFSKYPRRGGSNSWIISVIWFPLAFLRALWIMNSLFYWNLLRLKFGLFLNFFCWLFFGFFGFYFLLCLLCLLRLGKVYCFLVDLFLGKCLIGCFLYGFFGGGFLVL